jgi:transposase
VVEAVKAIAESVKGSKAKKSEKGISVARRTYTDRRKTKIAELRALKSKRIREFAARTKKLPASERDKQRREFKKKVESQFREMQTRFPTARGLKSVATIRELIRKLQSLRTAK